MTTIPIEVIIQDAESPVTPTPESGGETNITVPDTGTISDGGSNGGGIESSASIILPAIIAVLAIGAIVAMLIHKHHKHQNGKLSKKEKLATVASSTIAILAATVLVGNLVIPATKAATDDTNSSDNSSEEGTYLETEDKVSIVATIDKDSKEPTIVTVKDALYATTDASGYTVTMSMIEDALTSNLYLNGDGTSQYYIAPVEDGILGDNTWGYRLGEEDSYLPVPVADTPATVAEGEEAVTHEEINVYYTVKANNELPLGTYSGEIEYNITPVNPIDKLTYMQDFAKLSAEEKTALIAAMPEGEQYILKDNRDENPYYISKLADGNVWMTQNLDLDLNENIALTPADTDISENWTPLRSTINFTGTTVDGWQNNENTPYSANPGDVYYYTSNSDANDIQYNSLAECEAVHNDGTCQHYHAGNYYNWSAAVASNDTSEMTEQFSNAPDSICPAGWRLPKNANAESYTVGNEQIAQISSYDGILGEYSPDGPPGGMYSYQEGGLNNVRTASLYLVRSGDIENGLTHSTGGGGIYWSSTIFSGHEACRLFFMRNTIYSSYPFHKPLGYSVRCLAK